jgi:hypothetical protein
MLGTARRLRSASHPVALTDAAIASVHDCFPATVLLKQVLSLLDRLALRRVLRMGRTRPRLNDLPLPFRARNDVRLTVSAHRNSILIVGETTLARSGVDKNTCKRALCPLSAFCDRPPNELCVWCWCLF